jgi:YggT family protein
VIKTTICLLLQAYVILIFARIVLSWFPLEPGSTMATIYGFLYTLTEPVMGPVRRVIPPLGAGGMGIDLSPIIIVVGAQILQRAIC